MTKALPAKQTRHVQNEALEFVSAGKESPPIVLVNGAGGPMEGWLRVFDPLSRLSTVFAYNRPGIGGSSKPSTAQDGRTMVESLRALLGVIELAPPYLLVGHSIGGLIVNLFARLHPSETAGVVLLDAAAPEDVSAMAQHRSTLQKLAQRVTNAFAKRDPLAETEHIEETVTQIEQAPPFPPIPLVVLTGAKPAMRWATPAAALAARAEHQKQLAALSPKGTQIMATKSGHFPQFTEPDVVVDAVNRVLTVCHGTAE